MAASTTTDSPRRPADRATPDGPPPTPQREKDTVWAQFANYPQSKLREGEEQSPRGWKHYAGKIFGFTSWVYQLEEGFLQAGTEFIHMWMDVKNSILIPFARWNVELITGRKINDNLKHPILSTFVPKRLSTFVPEQYRYKAPPGHSKEERDQNRIPLRDVFIPERFRRNGKDAGQSLQGPDHGGPSQGATPPGPTQPGAGQAGPAKRPPISQVTKNVQRSHVAALLGKAFTPDNGVPSLAEILKDARITFGKLGEDGLERVLGATPRAAMNGLSTDQRTVFLTALNELAHVPGTLNVDLDGKNNVKMTGNATHVAAFGLIRGLTSRQGIVGSPTYWTGFGQGQAVRFVADDLTPKGRDFADTTKQMWRDSPTPGAPPGRDTGRDTGTSQGTGRSIS